MPASRLKTVSVVFLTRRHWPSHRWDRQGAASGIGHGTRLPKTEHRQSFQVRGRSFKERENGRLKKRISARDPLPGLRPGRAPWPRPVSFGQKDGLDGSSRQIYRTRGA